MNTQRAAKEPQVSNRSPAKGSDAVEYHRTNEVFIGIVGPMGSGASVAANQLKGVLMEKGFEVEIIKASQAIKLAAQKHGQKIPPNGRKTPETVKLMQDLGDEIRKGSLYGSQQENHSAIAQLIIHMNREVRARFHDVAFDEEKIITPNGKPRAFIIDSLKHPAEVALFRSIYGNGFFLLGIVCDPKIREKRILKNFIDRKLQGKKESIKAVKELLNRDANAEEKYGQQVEDTFRESDFFVDNSQKGNKELSKTGMNEPLKRFVNLLMHDIIIRPTIDETAMHQAYSAQLRSACLSRQVGAALVDKYGNVVATGTNDVPKAGGGLYGESAVQEDEFDKRCAYCDNPTCKNTIEQNKIIDEIIDTFSELDPKIDRAYFSNKLRKSGVGRILEFSRAVHAEMSAIISATISGVSTVGCKLYVTTYPCHYCARHIVAAGIYQVQYIEPYPKSKALELHEDSITTDSKKWNPPSIENAKKNKNPPNVLFQPFVGVSPKLYSRVFLKDRDYKDSKSGELKITPPEWGSSYQLIGASYLSMEQIVSTGGSNGESAS